MAREKKAEVAARDPFAELFDLDPWGGENDLRRMVDRLFADRPRASGALQPAVDITETEDEYAICAELPGVKKSDITLEVAEGTLSLRAEKKERREEKTERGRRLERSYGVFSRAFAMPANANTDKVKASFSDGVLRIEIPKRPEAKPAQIAIKG